MGESGFHEMQSIRRALQENVPMQLKDVLLCCGIAPEEIEKVYPEKHERNMKRW